MRISQTVVLFAVLFAAQPALIAQTPAGGPAEVQVVPASRQAQQRNYVKVVRVPGPPVSSVPAAYEGTRPFQSWQWFSRGGYATDRARAATRIQRYQPVNIYSARFAPYSYWGAGSFYRPISRSFPPVVRGAGRFRRW